MRFLVFILFLSFICFCSIASPTCLDIIKKLSSQDKCLSSRSSFKVAIASSVKNSRDFVGLLNKVPFKCNGTYFACGFTMSWVTEIFEGVGAQFSEYKHYDGYDGPLAGYTPEYEELMGMMKHSPFHVIYHLRHTGPHDHVITIEQLPRRLGYRVYQSYKDVHSLKAWLSSNLTGLFDAEHGDIMLPKTTQQMIDAQIRGLTNNRSSLQNLDDLPEIMQPFLPFLQYIRDFNETLVMNRFKKAWETYGQGKIISYNDFWNGYMKKFDKIVNYLKTYDNTTNPFPQDIYDSWIELFGAADNTVFPNFPTNGIISLVAPGVGYRFEVLSRIVMEKEEDKACLKNAKLLMGNDFDFSAERKIPL